MDALEILEREHRIVEEALAGLEAYAARIRGGEPVPPGDLGRFTEFFSEFADGCHHGKEEGILFTALEDAGMPAELGPLAQLLEEHEEGRRYVLRLSELAANEGTWTTWERKRLVEVIAAYTALLRQHILKEDRILFPMTRARLSGEQLERLREDLAAFEERETGEEEHERLHLIAEDLIHRYLGTARAHPVHPRPAG